jgi:hypothetical protein
MIVHKYAPTASDVHVNTPLTNISIAYLQNADHFVADKVFPNIPVTKQSDRYFTYDRGDFNRDEMEKRAPGTESAGGSYDIDNTPNYYADVYAFHKDIPDQVRANADAVLSPDREATEYVTHKALIKREALWAANYFTTSVWTTDQTTSNWGSSGTATDPMVDIRVGKTTVLKATGFEPNTLVLGKEVYDALADNADVIERVYSGQTPGNPAMGTIDAMRSLFEIDRILVMKAIKNTAIDGATATHAFIGGANALLAYVPPTPGIMTPAAGYTFSWNGWMGAGASGNRIKRFRLEREEADRIEIQMAFAQKVVSADLGYFFSTPITSA